eukprot:scaffold243396_cov37-Prasinocladus_malaysianus.AAC.1
MFLLGHETAGKQAHLEDVAMGNVWLVDGETKAGGQRRGALKQGGSRRAGNIANLHHQLLPDSLIQVGISRRDGSHVLEAVCPGGGLVRPALRPHEVPVEGVEVHAGVEKAPLLHRPQLTSQMRLGHHRLGLSVLGDGEVDWVARGVCLLTQGKDPGGTPRLHPQVPQVRHVAERIRDFKVGTDDGLSGGRHSDLQHLHQDIHTPSA